MSSVYLSLPFFSPLLNPGEEFFSPSAFSVHVKRLVTPAKQGDDGWRSVFVNGVLLHDLRTQYQEETAGAYYSGKASGAGSSSRKRAPQHGGDHYHHQQQQHEGGGGGKGKGAGKGGKGGKGGGAAAAAPKKPASGGKKKKGKANKELQELVRMALGWGMRWWGRKGHGCICGFKWRYQQTVVEL